MASSLPPPLRRLVRRKLINRVLRRTVRLPFLPREWRDRVPIVGVIKVPYAGKPLRLKTNNDDWIAKQLYFGGLMNYERETTELFLDLLGRTETFMDIGANTGVFALLAALQDPRRKVYAFEPVPAIYERLRENIQVNRLSNIEGYQVALSDFDGVSTLHVPPGEMPTEASLLSGFRPGTVAVEVQTLKLDTFVDQHRIAKVGLLKIDTETTEPKVLAGAKELIRRDRPLIICEVLAGVTEELLHEQFAGAAYQFFWITEAGLVAKDRIEGDRQYRNFNYLFAPEEKLSALPLR